MSFHGRGLSTRGQVFGCGQVNYWKCTHCKQTNYTIEWY